MAVKTAKALIKRKTDSGESRAWERCVIIDRNLPSRRGTRATSAFAARKPLPCVSIKPGNGWYPLLPPVWEPGKCSLAGGPSLDGFP